MTKMSNSGLFYTASFFATDKFRICFCKNLMAEAID